MNQDVFTQSARGAMTPPFPDVRYAVGRLMHPELGEIFDSVSLSLRAGQVHGELIRLHADRVETFSLSGTGRGDNLVLVLTEKHGRDRRPHERILLSPERGIHNISTATGLFIGQRRSVRARGEPASYCLDASDRVRIAPSRVHGWGLSAARNLAAGTEVLALNGHKADRQRTHTITLTERGLFDPAGYGRFLNHACEPNCRIAFSRTGTPVIIANQRVNAGEEIFVDYTAETAQMQSGFLCACPADIHRLSV